MATYSYVYTLGDWSLPDEAAVLVTFALGPVCECFTHVDS